MEKFANFFHVCRKCILLQFYRYNYLNIMQTANKLNAQLFN